MLSIREVQINDASRLAEIYSYYVKNTAVSFEYEVPTADEFEKRIKHTTEKYPYLVCVDDGKVVGYAYAGAYSARQAYDWMHTAACVGRFCGANRPRCAASGRSCSLI